MIYLDNAATTMPKPSWVIEAMTEAMVSAGNASRGVNDASLKASRIVSLAREEIARLFGFDFPGRVCFTSNATEALNTAILGLFVPGDHVITTAMEHNSVLRPLRRLKEEQGVEVTVLPVDEQGRFSYEELEGAIRENTRGVVLQHASNVTGNVTDLYRVGEICKAHGILLVVDGAQTAGIVPIHMKNMHIDVLCFTGHKGLLGPQGTGGVLVGEGVDIRPLKEGGSGMHSYDKRQPLAYPAHLEAGTLNIHGLAGLLAAVEKIREEGVEQIHAREEALARTFYHSIKTIPGLVLYGDYGRWDGAPGDHCERTAIVSLNIPGYDSGEVADELMERFGIATRSGAHCAPMAHESLGTKETGCVRFSFSVMNTLQEAETAAQAVDILVRE